MPLDADVAGSVPVLQTVSQATTKVRIKSVWFYYEQQVIILEVALGSVSNGEFLPVSTELWLLQGSDVATLMASAPNGASNVNVIRNLLVQIVTYIQGNPTKKQQMLDSKDLCIIAPGSFISIIPPAILELFKGV